MFFPKIVSLILLENEYIKRSAFIVRGKGKGKGALVHAMEAYSFSSIVVSEQVQALLPRPSIYPGGRKPHSL